MRLNEPPDTNEPRTLIDELIAEQRQLTAVERFSRRHDRHELGENTARYRDLMPLTAPAKGQQYAFEVDLDKCSGCKACVTACHSLNGLDDEETWRAVGLLVGEKPAPKSTPIEFRPFKAAQENVALAEDSQPYQFQSKAPATVPFSRHITTACHHCVDPGCLKGCPVLAYDKDPVTGIVRHLDDQCIGCQYCILKCPYDVPKYSAKRGIVRKCDMCANRLAVGEAPACVQACPNEAIRITVVEQQTVETKFREHSTTNPFLPGTTNPGYTLPTTRFLSKEPLPANLAPADNAELKLEHLHAPLVWMLVLTQFAAGGFALLPFVETAAKPMLALIAVIALQLGLIGSAFHLGKPLKAWRAFLGLRHSWLSREIVVFGGFAPLAMLVTGALWFPQWVPATLGKFLPLMEWNAAAVGLLGVFCSGMIYHDTHREFWQRGLSVGKFFGTTAILGLATAWLSLTPGSPLKSIVAVALALTAFGKLAYELSLLRRCPEDADRSGEVLDSSLARSAYLMKFKLGLLLRGRIALLWLGGIILPLVGLLPEVQTNWLAGTALAACLLSEFAERAMFFRAVVPLKMPGGFAA